VCLKNKDLWLYTDKIFQLIALLYGIRGLMGEKGLLEEDWNDRDNWRKKII
jgi:hypothetical protein